MDVYKAKIKSYGSLEKLTLLIAVIEDLHNKYLIRDTWYPTASMISLKYLLEDFVKHKARVRQLYFIGVFLQAKFNNRVFVKLDSRYAD